MSELATTLNAAAGASSADAARPLGRYWLLYMEAIVRMNIDADGGAASVERAVAFTERVGAPSLRASAAQLASTFNGFSEDPNDWEAGIVRAGDGLVLARSVGDPTITGDLLGSVAWLKARARRPDAFVACREALRHLDDMRYRAMGWPVLDAVSSCLAHAGELEPAGIVLGAVEPRYAAPSVRSQTLRDVVRRAVAEHPSSARWIERGAAMDYDAIVAYVLGLRPPALGDPPD